MARAKYLVAVAVMGLWGTQLQPTRLAATLELRLSQVDSGSPFRFENVSAIDVDDGGRLLVAEQASHEIRLFSNEGRHITTIGPLGSPTLGLGLITAVAFTQDSIIVADDAAMQRLHAIELGAAPSSATDAWSTPILGVGANGPRVLAVQRSDRGWIALLVKEFAADTFRAPILDHPEYSVRRIDIRSGQLGEALWQGVDDARWVIRGRSRELPVLAGRTVVQLTGAMVAHSWADSTSFEIIDIESGARRVMTVDVPRTRVQDSLRPSPEGARPSYRAVIGGIRQSRSGSVAVIRSDLDPRPSTPGDSVFIQIIESGGKTRGIVAMPPSFTLRAFVDTALVGIEEGSEVLRLSRETKTPVRAKQIVRYRVPGRPSR